MSSKEAAAYCEAVEGQFAWFSQLCMKAAISTHEDENGDKYGACPEHTTTKEATT